MKKELEALSVLLRSSSDVLDDNSLETLTSTLGENVNAMDVLSFHEARCFDRGYAVRLDSESAESVPIDFSRLYDLNNASSVREEDSLSYVMVGNVLLTLPVAEVAVSDMVTHVHSILRKLISGPFVLHHMNADGKMGSECIAGQSGSRFVAKPYLSPKPIPTSPKAPKIRSLSFDYPYVNCTACIGLSASSSTSRLSAMRDTAELHASRRNQLFRSHSVEKRSCRAPNPVGSKYISMYTWVAEESGGAGNSSSRWVGGMNNRTNSSHQSTVFPMYSSVEFDLNRVRLRDSSPAEVPLEVEIDVRDATEQTLMSVIQDLITRRDGATDFFSRRNENIKNKYAPMTAHLVSRAVAVSELSRFLSEEALGELLAIADNQGVKERPLLVQLDKGQWSRLCPKDFRVCSAMIGLTNLNIRVPLPEHGKGSLSGNRLINDFSDKFMNNKQWHIRLVLDPIQCPVFFPWDLSSQDNKSPSKSGLLQDLTPQDCLNGFREFKSGILVTKWSGVLEKFDDDDDLILTLDRSCGLQDCMQAVRNRLKFKHALQTPEIIFENHLGNHYLDGKLRSDLHWCSCEYLSLSLSKGPTLLLARKFDQPSLVVGASTELHESPQDQIPIPLSHNMMWDHQVAGGWSSNETFSSNDHNQLDESPSSKLHHFLSKISPQAEDTEPKSPKSPKSPMSPVPRYKKTFSLNNSPRILRSTRDSRQFEFSPFDPNLILTGSRSGVISLINRKLDFPLMQTRVDSSPILGLSWLSAHMNLALYGASSSGLVGIVRVGNTHIDHQPIGRFQNLSSVTVNCTDDYFLVSGFSRDVSLFDLVTGQRVSELREIHSNFINIIRFAHYSPHLFASSSFDSTCKLWDLRIATNPSRPVATYATPTLNVMCCFSPLDDNLLVSGLDSNVVQLSVKQGLIPNIPPETLAQSIPAKNSTSNYRRAVYLADGTRFITSGTDEDYMRVISSKTGASQGMYKFEGLLEAFEQRISSNYKSLTIKDRSIELSPRMVDPRGHGDQTITSASHSANYVQSLRGHPIYPNEVGVLLYPFDRSNSSFICTTSIPDENP